MAEGGSTTFENPAYEPDDPFDDDDEFDETHPFIPETSTPHTLGGERIQMQTMLHETSGLPEKSYVETSFSAPKTSEAAWVAAKDLFPNMSSSELKVSYNTKGKIQVKMFGAGKKLYSLITTERGTGREAINKSLPKEIKTALGPSKYEKIEQIEAQKQKELKEIQERDEQRERNKKELEEAAATLEKAKKDLEALEDSEAPEREIEKAKANERMAEADKVKANTKYFNDLWGEKRLNNSVEDSEKVIGALDDLEEED